MPKGIFQGYVLTILLYSTLLPLHAYSKCSVSPSPPPPLIQMLRQPLTQGIASDFSPFPPIALDICLYANSIALVAIHFKINTMN